MKKTKHNIAAFSNKAIIITLINRTNYKKLKVF